MLNPVAPVQMPAQVQQPMKGHDGQNHSDKPEPEKFNTILAREVAEKEPAPAAEHAKKATPDTRGRSAESAAAVSDEKADGTSKTGTAPVTDAAGAADNTVNMANSNNALAANQIPVFQTSLPGNSVSVEGMPPVVPAEVSAGNFVPHTMQTGLHEKSADAIPGSELAVAVPVQSFQFGSQSGFARNFAGSGENNPGHVLQNPHFADASASAAFSSGFQRHLLAHVAGTVSISPEKANSSHLLARMEGAERSWPAGHDMLQFHNQSGLHGGIPAGETVFPLQTGPDMPQLHGQSGPGGVTQTVSNTAVQTVALHHAGLDAQMGQPQWGDEFAQKIVWLAHQQHQVAELRLNPAHLGPVEILLNLTGDNGAQASAQFVSPHPAVREAIEAALPRLREMMADNGIQLGDVMVGAESFQRQEQGERQGGQHAKHAHGFNARDASNLSLEKQLIPGKHNGIVNTFA